MNMEYEPFIDAYGLFHCAISLKVAIEVELEMFNDNMHRFLELGGEKSYLNEDTYYLAQAFKNQADANSSTLRVLRRLAEQFKATLSPKAIDDINKSFEALDNSNNRKAG